MTFFCIFSFTPYEIEEGMSSAVRSLLQSCSETTLNFLLSAAGLLLAVPVGNMAFLLTIPVLYISVGGIFVIVLGCLPTCHIAARMRQLCFHCTNNVTVRCYVNTTIRCITLLGIREKLCVARPTFAIFTSAKNESMSVLKMLQRDFAILPEVLISVPST